MRKLTALFVLLVPTLAACGSTSTGAAPAPAVQGVASSALVDSNVQGAAVAVEAWYAQNGTYAGVTVDALRAVDPMLPDVRIAWATAQAVCLESTAAGATASLVRPGGTVQNGPCQATAG